MDLIPKPLRHPFAVCMLFFLMALNVSQAFGEDDSITPSSLIKFSAGVISGFLIHEGAHLLVAEVTGTEMDWEIGDYNQPIGFSEHADSDAKGVAINSAGLVTQAIGAEVVLQVDRIDKNDAYWRGMMTWDILNPILYALDYWFIGITNKADHNSYQGDIQGIEFYSDKTAANVFAASVAGIGVFQGYRFLKTQTWAPDWIKNENHDLAFTSMPSEGFKMNYTYRF